MKTSEEIEGGLTMNQRMFFALHKCSKRSVCFVLCLVMLSASAAALAWGESNADLYEKAMGLLKERDYAKASDAFAALGGYSDSARYTMYCNAIVAGDSGLFSVAVDNLKSLDGFLDSSLLATYYAGLSWESVEEYERALEIFSGITLYRDVSSRITDYPERISARDYRKADANEQAGKLEASLTGFKALGSYKDSSSRAESVQDKIYERDYQKAAADELAENFEDALAGFKALGSYKDSAARTEAVQAKIYEKDYQKAAADELAENFEDALAGFKALGSYKDSAARAEAVQAKIYEKDYQKAAEFAAADDFINAYELFQQLGAYKDSAARASALEKPAKYAQGQSFIEKGSYKEALQVFRELGDYQDSEAKAYALGITEFAKLKTVAPGAATFEFHESYGFVNYLEGILIAPQWASVKVLSDDRIAVKQAGKGGKYGVIDLSGSLVSDYRWSDISAFSDEGVCTIATESGSGWSSTTTYGLMNHDGKVILQCNWSMVGESSYSAYKPVFHDGRIMIRSADKTYGFASVDGSIAVPAVYDSCQDFSNGLAAVKSGSNWGFIDPNNKTVIGFKYQEVYSFSSLGTADVCKDSEWQIIDQNGNLVYFKTDAIPAQSETSQNEADDLKNRVVTRLVSEGIGNKDTCEAFVQALLEGDTAAEKAILTTWLDGINWTVNKNIYDFIDRCYNKGANFSSIWEIAESLGIK